MKYIEEPQDEAGLTTAFQTWPRKGIEKDLSHFIWIKSISKG